MAAQLKDGSYIIEVTLNGGSGRATIQSPTVLKVEDGHMQARIEWSSPYYDLMTVSGSDYTPVNTEGNSRFLIDVPALDREIPITAETLAMSQPHTVEYTLYFKSSTVQQANGGYYLFATGAVMVLATAVLALRLAFTARGKKA